MYKHMSPITDQMERCKGPGFCKYGNDETPPVHYEIEGGVTYRLDESGVKTVVDPQAEIEAHNNSLHGEEAIKTLSKATRGNHFLSDDIDDDVSDDAYNAVSAANAVESLIQAGHYATAIATLEESAKKLYAESNDEDLNDDDSDELHYEAQRMESRAKELRKELVRADARMLGVPNLSEKGFEAPKAQYEDIALQVRWMGLSKNDQRKVAAAMNTAWQLHHGQVRKSTDIPYITHPLSNMQRLISYGVTDPDMLAAAALHDCVEDCGHEFNEKTGRSNKSNGREEVQSHLNARFGARTGKIVAAVSNEEIKNSNWSTEEKDANYIRHASEQIRADFGAFMVKYSDYLDNAGTLKEAKFDDPKRKKKLAKKYLPLAQAFVETAKYHSETGDFKLSDKGKKMFMEEIRRVADDLQSVLAE